MTQAEAKKRVESLQSEIDIHLGKLANASPPPPDDWDHWVWEIKNWLDQQRAKLKFMGRKTMQLYRNQINESARLLAEQIKRMQPAIVPVLLHYRVVARITYTTPDGTEMTRTRYADGTVETTQDR